MAADTCSLHCGQFSGVSETAFLEAEQSLTAIFKLVDYDKASRTLRLCGARDISDTPGTLAPLLDTLSRLPDAGGKGRLMLNCAGIIEVCYFRHKMWKLEAVPMPPDPFDGVHHA